MPPHSAHPLGPVGKNRPCLLHGVVGGRCLVDASLEVKWGHHPIWLVVNLPYMVVYMDNLWLIYGISMDNL